MIVYLLKMIACSGLLLLIYFLFLEKEKMYRFNRFYLLVSIAVALVAPSVTFHLLKNSPLQTVNDFVIPIDNFKPNEITLDQKVSAVTGTVKHFDLDQILILVYSIITAVFFIMFVRNLLMMYSKIRGKEYIFYKDSKLVLIDENLTPHSFFNYIFLNKIEYEKESIEPEIVYHELSHTKQKHTIDILLIELTVVFFWFNPFIYLYRKAIKLNHEFLADEGVIKQFQNTHTYQYLLLSKAGMQKAYAVTSQFDFSPVKKRLIMITKYTSPKKAFLKYCLAVALALASLFTFSTKDILAKGNETPQLNKDSFQQSSTETKDTTKPVHFDRYAGGSEEGVTPEVLKEYQNTINRTKTPEISWIKFREIIPKDDYKRLETIFMKMNYQQQAAQTVAFVKPSKPLPRVVPTKQQFESFKNSKIYGVWVNNKKVPNSELNDHSAKDFAQVFISKLYGAAKKNKSYSYQVDLMTKEYYQAYYDQTIADTSNTMVFQGRRRLKK